MKYIIAAHFNAQFSTLNFNFLIIAEFLKFVNNY